jgi:hypothetical protein
VRVARTFSLTATSVAFATPPADGVCAAPVRYTFVWLGVSPLSESYETAERAGAMGAFYGSGAD